MSPIETLATRQLEAYNRADLDAFCACFHPSVRVLDGDDLLYEGLETFRDRYRAKFEAGGFGATVPTRACAGNHCVDEEDWWVDRPEGQIVGRLLIRYALRDDRIGVVQFFR